MLSNPSCLCNSVLLLLGTVFLWMDAHDWRKVLMRMKFHWGEWTSWSKRAKEFEFTSKLCCLFKTKNSCFFNFWFPTFSLFPYILSPPLGLSGNTHEFPTENLIRFWNIMELKQENWAVFCKLKSLLISWFCSMIFMTDFWHLLCYFYCLLLIVLAKSLFCSVSQRNMQLLFPFFN